MLNIQLKDNSKARILDPDLLNEYSAGDPDKTYRAQEDYYNFIKNKHHILMKIYHNPRCAKSRAGLKYLEEQAYDIEIKKYMTEGLTEKELKEIISLSGYKPFDLVRTQEKEYVQNYRGKKITDSEWIKILAENPKLLQRPIVVNGNKAVLANPPEKIDDIV